MSSAQLANLKCFHSVNNIIKSNKSAIRCKSVKMKTQPDTRQR